MSLLRDIQEAAVSPDRDVATLLRKCKVLSARLGNVEFKHWVDQELNGYDDLSSLPEYRKLQVESFGHFSGLFGSGLRNAPIPPSCIPERLREPVRFSYLMQPISAYTSLVDKSTASNAKENWPADLVACVGRDIYENMNCLAAWKIIPYNAIVALVDTIKTRVLNFCLEIEAVAPDAGEASLNSPPISQEKVTQVFNTYITGTVQNVAAGGTHFKQETTSTTGVADELFSQLLASIGSVSHPSAYQMALAVEEMRQAAGTPSFGERYTAFMALFANHLQVYGTVLAPYLSGLATMAIS